MADAAEGLKPVSLELGGKSPNVIFEDAQLTAATMMASMGVFGMSGQACAAGSRLLVQRSVYETVLEQVAGMAQGLPIGDPMDGFTMVGPLVSTAHRERVQALVAAGKAEGARVHLEVPVPDGLEGGSFLGPVIFADVTPEMQIWREEVFGPVLCVTPFDSEEEAIALANDTSYGLAAGVWTQDIDRAHRVAHAISAGTVWINTYGVLPHTAPFGGFKQSGWGREGGRDALLEYTQIKNVMVGLK